MTHDDGWYRIVSREEASDNRALVVDDLPSTRLLLSDMLKEMGFDQVEGAADGEEALTKLKERTVKLVVCDQSMRGMSGLEFLEAIRQHPNLIDIPVIMLSSSRDTPLIDAALTLGAADYMVKPISFQLLKRKVSDVLMRRR
jgi:two-component system chemotaxis response regulator CheY